MTDKDLARWEKTRAMGRTRYVIWYGFLLWGFGTGLLWAIMMTGIQGWDRLWNNLAWGLIGFPIGGLLFGSMMWKLQEANYRKLMGEKAGDPPA